MKYEIVGNSYYLITDKKEIERTDGKESNLKIKNGKVTIGIYGYIKEVEIEWLYWLSYFKLEMPKGYEDRVFDIEFKDFFSLKHMRVDPKMVVFKKPVYLKEDDNYRIIARFPNYAISTEGVVYNIRLKRHTKPSIRFRKNETSYLASSIADQSNLYTKNDRLTHRLVATTWVDNDDFIKYYLVDHKDGNKANCHYTNLRWTNHKGNNSAIPYQGLSSQAISVTIRDIDTGEVKTFPSMGEACTYMERSKIDTQHTPLRPNKIWRTKKGIFEIKETSDKRDWYYLDKSKIPTKNQKVEITITKENGDVVIVRSKDDFITKLFNNKKVADNIEGLIRVYKKRHPNDKLVYKKLDNHTKDVFYIAKNIKTNEIIRNKSLLKLSEVTDVKYSSARKSTSTNGKYQYNDWVFKIDNRKPFSLIGNFNNVNKPVELILLDTTTNEETKFKSLRGVGRHLNIDKKTVKKLLISGDLLYNKYLLHKHPCSRNAA